MAAPAKTATPPHAGQTRLSQLMRGLGEISLCTSRKDALQRAAHLAVEVFRAESAVITLLGDDGERIESHASPTGHRTSQPDAAPFLGIPLACHGIVRGSLYLTGTSQTSFSEDDENLAILLTASAAAVLDRLDWSTERTLLARSHERLLSTLSHDLGNALTAIYGWGDMMVRRRDPAMVPPAAYELLSATENAIGLLHDAVDLTRLEFKTFAPVISAVSASEVLENVASRAESTARTLAIELRTDYPVEGTRILSDRRRLEQLLVHLLLDVIEHSGGESVVRLAGRLEADHVVFAIERIEPGPSSASAPRIAEESGLDPDRGLALWQRIGALFGAHVMVPHGGKNRPGYRIAIGRAEE
jgi:signal transduction histidine kinase